MRLSSLFIGATLLAVAPAALGTEPCAPRTMRPYHVSAFASDSSGSISATTVASRPAGSELELQADCLAWEASLTPKAELIGVVPFSPPVPSGAYRPQVAAPQETVRIASSAAGGQVRSSSLGASLFEATPGTGAFTLGATLIPVP